MRKFLISAAVAASALAVATPAAAQWYPPQQPAYGYGYGYNNNYGQVRSLQARIDSIQRQIIQLDRRNQISNREARALRYRSVILERQLRTLAGRGLGPYERDVMQQRIAQLSWQVRAEANEGRRWSSNNNRRNGRNYDRQHNRWHDRNND